MFKISEKILAPSAATSYNLGLCAQGLGRTSEALQYMIGATELDPNFEPARQSRQKLEAQIK
jgi:Tfp pilus assembly protein PilF